MTPDAQQPQREHPPKWESQEQCENCDFLKKESVEWGFNPFCHGFGNHVQGAKIPHEVFMWIKRYGCASHTRTRPHTPAPELYNVLLKSANELERDKELVDAYKRGKDDAANAATLKARDEAIQEFLDCAFLPGIVHPDSEEGKFLKIIAKKLRSTTAAQERTP